GRRLPRRRARTHARGRRDHAEQRRRRVLRRRAGADVRRISSSRSFIPAALVLVLFLVYLVQDNGSFGAIEALGISNAALPLALVAAGQTFVILTNGIDLSTGSIVTLSNVTCAVVAGRRPARPRVLP